MTARNEMGERQERASDFKFKSQRSNGLQRAIKPQKSGTRAAGEVCRGKCLPAATVEISSNISLDGAR